MNVENDRKHYALQISREYFGACLPRHGASQTGGQRIDLFRQRSPSNGSGRNYGIGSVFWRPIFTIENCLRNYWKLPTSFALIDVSLNSLAR